MALNFTIIYGSYRSPRMGIRAVHHLKSQIEVSGNNAVVVDAQTTGLPLLEKRFVDYAESTAPQILNDLRDIYAKTNAFILVAGEYNGAIQPGLKNLLDYFYMEYFHRPCGLVTYSPGKLGGARVSGELRTLTGIFGMPAIPAILSIPEIHLALDENGNALDSSVVQNSTTFLKELGWYAKALKNAPPLNG